MIFNLIKCAKDLIFNNTKSGMRATNVQEAIDELKDCMGMELLWQNPNPTSEFAGQTITFDMSKYKAFVISARYSTDVATTSFSLFPNDIGNDYSLWSNQYKFAVRFINITSNGIAFKGAYMVNSYGSPTNNQGCAIPVKIWGIK